MALVKGKSYLLSVMVFFPLFGALFMIFFLRDGQTNALRLVAVIAAAVPFVLAIYLFQNFDRTLGMAGRQLRATVRPPLRLDRELQHRVSSSASTASPWRWCILTGIVCLIAVGASWSVKKQLRGYFVMFLLLETGMMGVFCALDFFLFYVFWEVMLLPMYFLIGVWGAPPRVEATAACAAGPTRRSSSSSTPWPARC